MMLQLVISLTVLNICYFVISLVTDNYKMADIRQELTIITDKWRGTISKSSILITRNTCFIKARFTFRLPVTGGGSFYSFHSTNVCWWHLWIFHICLQDKLCDTAFSAFWWQSSELYLKGGKLELLILFLTTIM